MRRQGDVQIVALGYKVPSSLHDDSDVLAFASDILGNGPAARLHKLLIDSGKASEVFAFGQTGYAPGLQLFGAVVKKGDPIEPVRAAMTAGGGGLRAPSGRRRRKWSGCAATSPTRSTRA